MKRKVGRKGGEEGGKVGREYKEEGRMERKKMDMMMCRQLQSL